MIPSKNWQKKVNGQNHHQPKEQRLQTVPNIWLHIRNRGLIALTNF